MPAEWEPHAATWLAWPHYHGDWPGKFEPIPWVYAEIIRNLAKHERVELIVNNAAAARQARRVLERADAFSANIRFHRWPTNRVWLRDSGCIFLKCGADAPARRKAGAAEATRPQVSLQRLGEILQLALRRKDRQPDGEPKARPRQHREILARCIQSAKARASSSKADRSTSTAPARSSPPRNACSAKCSSAIRT